VVFIFLLVAVVVAAAAAAVWLFLLLFLDLDGEQRSDKPRKSASHIHACQVRIAGEAVGGPFQSHGVGAVEVRRKGARRP
jgi:hypothetical protein